MTRPRTRPPAICGLVTDLDGVLWRGRTPLPGVRELFAWLRQAGIPFVLATNNASRPPEHYVRRLAEMGVSLEAAQVVTSALATARWLRATHGPGTPVHVLGEDALAGALADAGMRLVVGDHDPAAVVVAGIDFHLTYRKLARAAAHILRGAAFVGTNGDRTYPAEDGLMPGAGAILAALEACTGVSPTRIGKPERPLFDMALERLGTPPERTLMVGDRLDTDIAGGRRAGLRTALVATGVDDALAAERAAVRPDLVVPDLPALLAELRAAG